MTTQLEKHNDKAMVGLALSVLDSSGQSLPYEKPSDEELALMLEGKLDSTRHAQVISLLAHDQNLLNRWLSLQETAEVLNISSNTETEEESQSTSMMSRFLALWEKHSANWLRGGAGAALACTFLFTLYVQEPPNNISNIYDQYGTPWTKQQVDNFKVENNVLLSDSALPNVGESRSLTSDETSEETTKPVNLYDQQLMQGMIFGLSRLGVTISHDTSFDENTEDSYTEIEEQTPQQVFWSTGYLSVLIISNCQKQGNDEFFNKTAPIVAQLKEKLSTIDDFIAEYLSQDTKGNTSEKDVVCSFSQRTIESIKANLQ